MGCNILLNTSVFIISMILFLANTLKFWSYPVPFKRLLFVFNIAPLLLLISSVSANAGQSGEIIATFNGDDISYKTVERGSEMDIYDAEMKLYDIRMNRLKEILIEKLIKLDQRSKGLSNQQFIDKYITKPLKVTDAMITGFIRQKRIPAEKVDNKLKQQVRQYLQGQHYVRQIETWFLAQSEKHQIKINLPTPEEPRFHVDIGDAPYLGGKDAKVTIVEFSDFECPYCAKASKVVRQLISKYGDDIKIAYKHFPLSFHPNAQKAAEAGVCATEQSHDYFWKLHDQLFADYRNLSIGNMKDKAKALGLNYEQFSECLTSGKYASKVAQDTKEGMQVGIMSTPAFFINGRLVKGAQPLEVFIEKIDAELAK